MKFVIGPDIQYEHLGEQGMEKWYLNPDLIGRFQGGDLGKEYQNKANDFNRLSSVVSLIAESYEQHRYDFSELEGLPPQFKVRLKELSNRFSRRVSGEKTAFYLHSAEKFSEFFFINKHCSRWDSNVVSKYSKNIYRTLFNNIPTASSDVRDISIFITKDPLLNRLYLLKNPSLSPDHILAVLCLAGIDFELPAIFCSENSVLQEVREKYSDEREEYIYFFREFVQECYERLVEEYYADAWDYAKYVTNQKLSISVRNYEKAIMSGDKVLVKNLKTSATEGIPAIANTLEDANGSITRKIGIEVLKVLCSGMSEKMSEQRADEQFGMASYIFKLKKDLT